MCLIILIKKSARLRVFPSPAVYKQYYDRFDHHYTVKFDNFLT